MVAVVYCVQLGVSGGQRSGSLHSFLLVLFSTTEPALDVWGDTKTVGPLKSAGGCWGSVTSCAALPPRAHFLSRLAFRAFTSTSLPPQISEVWW